MQIMRYRLTTSHDIYPFNIALVVDLHGKPYQKVIDSLNNTHPDFIAIVGDVVNGDDDIYPLDFFQHCAIIAPTFFSLGNHERKISDK